MKMVAEFKFESCCHSERQMWFLVAADYKIWKFSKVPHFKSSGVIFSQLDPLKMQWLLHKVMSPLSLEERVRDSLHTLSRTLIKKIK